MSLKKVVAWLVVAFVVFYVIQAPEQSAQMVKNAGQALGNAASSLAAVRRLARLGRRDRPGSREVPDPPAHARTSRSTCSRTRGR